MKVEGQCHCGAISYEAEVEPDNIAICHCRDYQRLLGTAFRANVPAPVERFRLLGGEPRRTLKPALAARSACTLSVANAARPCIHVRSKIPRPTRYA